MRAYDIALSFAGEQRSIAEILATALRSSGYNVFYDYFEKAELWGRDLSVELPRRYEAARFCVMLISDFYLNKMWTTLERQTIISKFLKQKGNDYILPVRLDGCKTEVPGLSDMISYIDIDTNSKTGMDFLISVTKQVLDERL